MPHTPRSASTRTRALAGLALAAGAILLTAPLQAQTKYPSGPLKLVVPFAAGGVADASSRLVMEKVGERLGQRVVIENVPGPGGIQAARNVLNAPADGQTLALLTNGTSISAALFKQLPFDPTTQFQAVSALGFFEFILFTGGTSPYKTLGDVLKAAKDKPGALNIGTIVAGSTQHLTSELFRSSAGVDIRHVPFKGTPDLLLSTMRNDVELMVEALAPIKSNLEDGKVRALAVSSPTRSRALPDVPTVAEAGVPGFDVVSWNAVFVKAGTPEDIVKTLNTAMREALADKELNAKLLALGVDGLATTPEEIARRLKDDIGKWNAVIEKAGIEKR